MDAPVKISLRDESALTWYYLHGERQFQRSTHGAMVERLIRDSMGSARCGCCGGVGILGDAAAVRRHTARYRPTDDERRSVWVWRDSLTLVDPAKLRDSALRAMLIEERQIAERPAAHVVGSECRVCKGTGWVSRRRPARECQHCARRRTETELPDGTVMVDVEPRWAWRERRRTCTECGGTGVAATTVESTCPEQESDGGEVSGDVLRNFARVNRRLRRLGTARCVLELYYGCHGQSWADQPGGRMLALEAHTAAGQRLLRRTRRKGDEATEAGPEERLAAQMALQRQSPEAWRRKLLDEAAQEAARMYQEAVLAWVRTGDTHGDRTTLEGLLDAVDATAEKYEAWLDRNPDCWGDGSGGAV